VGVPKLVRVYRKLGSKANLTLALNISSNPKLNPNPNLLGRGSFGDELTATHCDPVLTTVVFTDGSVAEWLACRTQARKSMGSNRSRDAVE